MFSPMAHAVAPAGAGAVSSNLLTSILILTIGSPELPLLTGPQHRVM